MENQNLIIDISVRNLVEFTLRSGSINSQYRSSKRANEGTEIHSKLQKKHERLTRLNNLTYDKEVPVKIQTQYKEFLFDIEGRIDGVVEEFFPDGKKKTLHIEEIKSTTDIENVIENFEHWHFAQAKCYAYMYALAEDFSDIVIHITYCQVETFEEKTFEKHFCFNEIKQFFYDLLKKYYKWQKLYYENSLKKIDTLKRLSFPFGNYRKGQRKFATAIYKTLISKKKIFAQAPTGTGKTVSTVFPTLKFIGEKNILFAKVFYATAKTITRQNAQDIIKKMQEQGLFIKAVSITAKDKICICEEKSCTPEKCQFANGHFDRVNDALFEMLTNEEIICKDVVLNYAKKFNVCPFELTLDATTFSDFIICDYNYIFDPKVKLKRFFGEDAKGDFIILIDEAHNLPDRAREMFSATISKEEVLFCMKSLQDKRLPIYKAFSKLNRYLLNIKKTIGEEKAIINNKYPEELIFLLMDIRVKCDKWLSKNEGLESYETVLELYFKVLDFLRISDFFSKDYVFLSFIDDGEFKAKLLCINPSKILQSEQQNFLSTIFFSATLTPMDYFIDILGGNEKDNFISITSPFDKENLTVTVDTSVSTKYKDREKSIPIISQKIFSAINKRIGNHFVFFPSYEYMEKVGSLFVSQYPDVNCVIQPRNLTEDEREDFLLQFVENPTENFVAFVVLGGVFSEGIDLVGDRLCGAIIVGVGLPLITTERNIIKDYYNNYNNKGFDYAYTYNGFIKVLQAGGRVIRTETDTGYILLLDSRFGEWKYKEMFPSWWK